MPLVRGYSRDSIQENIRRELLAGKPFAQAVRISYETARRAWRSSHPSGPYPRHLRGRK